MAELWWRCGSHFCGGERARRWQSLLGNGGALLLRAVEAMEMKIGLVNWSGRRVGGSCRGQQRQDSRGTWQRGQAAGDGWCHAAVDF